MDARSDERPLGQLFGDLSRQLSTLVRQEIALARAELTTRVGSAGRGAAKGGAGGAVAYAGLLVLLGAATLLLIEMGLKAWTAALLVGVVTPAAGGALAACGRQEIAKTDLSPRRTIETIQDDAEWAKEQLK